MSQENVEIVRQIMDAWNRRDIEGLIALVDPEVEYVNSPTAVEPGTRRGLDAVAAVARTQWETLDGRLVTDRLHDRGDQIISEGRVSGLMPGSEARIDTPVLSSWTISDGKVIRVEMLGTGPEFEDALRAAGLSE
jgi:ketosteroid isomerase-like protein